MMFLSADVPPGVPQCSDGVPPSGVPPGVSPAAADVPRGVPPLHKIVKCSYPLSVIFIP